MSNILLALADRSVSSGMRCRGKERTGLFQQRSLLKGLVERVAGTYSRHIGSKFIPLDIACYAF